jgi:N2-acetyl-L-2,4-diaminobutanoate deacetylase
MPGGQPALTAHAQMSGILTARHVPGLVKMGDCIGVVAQVV